MEHTRSERGSGSERERALEREVAELRRMIESRNDKAALPFWQSACKSEAVTARQWRFLVKP